MYIVFIGVTRLRQASLKCTITWYNYYITHDKRGMIHGDTLRDVYPDNTITLVKLYITDQIIIDIYVLLYYIYI